MALQTARMEKEHKMARSLGYLPQPGMSAGAGVGSALGAFGQTMNQLGQLTIDDKKQKKDEALQDAKLTLAQNADKRGDEELKLKADEVSGKNKYYDDKTKAERQKQLDEHIKAQNMAGAFRVLHPEATKNLNDEQVMAWGEHMDKLLPKDRKIDKIDARITEDGNKIVTYFDTADNNIKELNMGKVKTDWNEKKKSSDIPEGWVSVGKDFQIDYGHEGNTKQTKDGRYIAPLPYVNSKFSEQSDGNKKLLDEDL